MQFRGMRLEQLIEKAPTAALIIFCGGTSKEEAKEYVRKQKEAAESNAHGGDYLNQQIWRVYRIPAGEDEIGRLRTHLHSILCREAIAQQIES